MQSIGNALALFVVVKLTGDFVIGLLPALRLWKEICVTSFRAAQRSSKGK